MWLSHKSNTFQLERDVAIPYLGWIKHKSDWLHSFIFDQGRRSKQWCGLIYYCCRRDYELKDLSHFDQCKLIIGPIAGHHKKKYQAMTELSPSHSRSCPPNEQARRKTIHLFEWPGSDTVAREDMQRVMLPFTTNQRSRSYQIKANIWTAQCW